MNGFDVLQQAINAAKPVMTKQLVAWLNKENKRVVHEWAQWDGTKSQGVEINNRQCARIDAYRLVTGA